MLYRIFAIFNKEILILRRDKAGMAVLYLMPLALIFIMVFIQDRTFHFLQDVQIPVLFLNEDQSTVGNALERNLANIRQIDLYYEVAGETATEEAVKEAVAAGDFKAGIIIPAGLTQNSLKRMKQDQGLAIGQVTVYFDPAIKQNIRRLIESILNEILARTETILLYEFVKEQVSYFGTQFNSILSVPDSNLIKKGLLHINSVSLNREKSSVLPNSVQHNVPSWTLFAMFFIVVPLAGGMIQERDEGSMRRLLSMPVSYLELLAGKLIVYLMVCLSQFFIMLMAGMFIMPLLGFPELQIGSSISAMFFVTLASAFAAVGYGLMVGTFARTQQQASSFGAISVIIAAAVGGIWVPIFIMPEMMQTISNFSPLAWGLNGFHEVFLRNGNLSTVIKDILFLLLFFLFTLSLSLFKFKVRKQ